MNNYSRKLLLLQVLLLIIISCKQYQSQDLINSKFTIDKSSVKEDSYLSKNLDQLFKADGLTYFEPDYSGTAFENYYVKNIVIQNKSNRKSNYLLFFNKNNILTDTLKIPENHIYSLNVDFDNDKKGVAVGIFDLHKSYFKITNKFELNKNLKIKPLSINTKINHCPIPVELLSEENVGLEEHFTFGIENQKQVKVNVKAPSNDFSKWIGNYKADIEITRTDGDYNIDYVIKILNKNDVLITEKINNEDNNVPDIFIKSVSGDQLIMKSKTDDAVEYIISKIDGQYYIMGNTVYMLNPPNDRYVLNKEM